MASNWSTPAGIHTPPRRKSISHLSPEASRPNFQARTGFGPEVFAYAGNDGNFTGGSPSSDDLDFYNKNGFYVYGGYGYGFAIINYFSL